MIKIRLNSGNKSKFFIACLSILLSIFITSIGPQHTYAEDRYSSTNEGGLYGGGCGLNKTDSSMFTEGQTYFDNCAGVAWRKYNLKDAIKTQQYVGGQATINTFDETDPNNILFAGYPQVTGGSLKNCDTLGATEYYRLALEMYKLHWDGSKWTNGGWGPRGSSSWQQIGLVPVNKVSGTLTGQSSSTSNATYANVGEGWESVLNKFKDAYKASGKTETQALADWPSVSAFCYNPDWSSGEYGGKFSTKSTVKAAGGQKTTGWDGSMRSAPFGITSDQNSVTVQFKHQIQFKANKKDDKTITDVSTKWTITTDGATDSSAPTTPQEYKVKVNKDDIKSPVYTSSTITVDISSLGDGDKKLVCQKISYDPKTVTVKKENGAWKTTTSDKGSSEACVEITKSATPPPPPGGGAITPPIKEEDAGQVEFWGTTSVKVNATGDIPSGLEAEVTTKNPPTDKKNVLIKFSTNQASVTVNFAHNLYYKNSISPLPDESAGDTFDEKDSLCTNWEVASSGGTGTSASGTYCVDSSDLSVMDGGPEEVSSEAVTINLNPGDQKKVCQSLYHEPTLIKVKRRTVYSDTETETVCESDSGWADISSLIALAPPAYSNYSHGIRLASFNKTALGRQVADTSYRCKEDSSLTTEADCTGATDAAGNPLNYTWERCEDVYKLDHWEYFVSSSEGEARDEACVEVTRPDPNEPSGDGPKSPNSSLEIKPMYAGENAEISWGFPTPSKVTAYDTRRVRRAPIAMLIKDNTPVPGYPTKIQQGSKTGGATPWNQSNRLNPCAFHATNGLSPQVWCNLLTSPTTGTPLTGNEQASYVPYDMANKVTAEFQATYKITVPNLVGYKYCHSLGYYFEYWYAIIYDNNLMSGWTHDADKDYWADFGAVCRPIVKKPSTSFWNGGVFGGNFSTSIALRGTAGPSASESGYQPASANTDRLAYGSWTEYLNPARGTVSQFVSGSNLSRGLNISPAVTFDTYSHGSSMTIANTSSTLGSSGIPPSSTLLTKLQQYFSASLNCSVLGGATVTSTVICRSTGPVSITGDIKVQTSGVTSIYKLPQVVIVADGNINIAPNVERVDAWLITKDGSVDTCNDGTPISNIFETDLETKTINNAGSNQKCDKPLAINGPVVAKNLKLNRTYGADDRVSYSPAAKKYTAAEIFNLSADTYLWGYARASNIDSSYTESYIRELAPRY